VSCARTRELLDAYVDGELESAAVAELDGHLGGCPDCARLRDDRRALSAEIRAGAPYFRAPEHLRSAIGRALRPEPVRPRRAPAWTLWGAIAGVAAAAGLVLGVWLGRPPSDGPPHDAIVARHVASLAPGATLVDVTSSDRHTIKPWFAGRTDFAPLVTDLSKEGFALVGGRLDRVADHAAAVVVYRIRNHYVNLFMWRASTGAAEPVALEQARGFEVATWSAAGVRYTAISDVSRADFERFTRLATAP
jgi:anti-sigma factor RsiW